jgi:hypothetical protein
MVKKKTEKTEKTEKSDIIYAPVDPVYRIPDDRINSEQLVQRALTKFESFSEDREEWLNRREEYYLQWDDYVSPIRKGAWDGASNLHLPMTEVQCNLMHARLMQAFFFIDPWFYVDPQEDIDASRVNKIQLMMKYILKRYVNFHQGIYSTIDDWCWDNVTEGMGILGRDWQIMNRRFKTVERNEDFMKQKMDLQHLLDSDIDEKDFAVQVKDLIKQPYIEKNVVSNIFNGPILRALNPIYVLFKGVVPDATDLDLQETVIEVCYFTKDELIGFAQQEMFDAEVVDEILSRPPSDRGSDNRYTRGTQVEFSKDRVTGVRTVDAATKDDEYEFYKVWDRVSLEKNGVKSRSHSSGGMRTGKLNDELVYYVHPRSRKLARWTYLDRIHANGKRGIHMSHLYRRPRRSIGRGIVETQYPLNETSDLLINQSIDAGLLANNPMFGYRGNSTFDPQEVRIEPGLGLKMDDPNNDIRFFNWPVNPNWGAQTQSVLQGFSQQLTSLGPLAAGQVGNNVGPLRSNSGAQTLLGEMNTNLDVVINRLKQTFSAVMEGVYADCIDRMPDTMKIAVLGASDEPTLDSDGAPMFMDVSREELKARIHFGLYANSQNMNKAAQLEAAQQRAQFLLQRIGIESGIVKPENIYEIYMDVIKAQGTQQPWRFISKPTGGVAVPLEYELMMMAQGIMPPVILNDPQHKTKLAKLKEIDFAAAAAEVRYGKIHPNAIKLLEQVIAQHESMLATVEQPTNLKNPTGTNQSPTLGAQDSGMPQQGQAMPAEGPMEPPGGMPEGSPMPTP